jgi:predicted flap endonuclease-1-like 5' DNA nuclease
MRRAVARFLSATRPLFIPPAAPSSSAASPALERPPTSALDAMRCPAPVPTARGAGAAGAMAAAPPTGSRLSGLSAHRDGKAALATMPPPARLLSAPLASRSSPSGPPGSSPAPPAARRASSSPESAQEDASASPDLRRVPGVGLKNELLLRGAGIHCLADLAAAFHADAAGGGVAARMVEYLQVRAPEILERRDCGAHFCRRDVMRAAGRPGVVSAGACSPLQFGAPIVLITRMQPPFKKKRKKDARALTHILTPLSSPGPIFSGPRRHPPRRLRPPHRKPRRRPAPPGRGGSGCGRPGEGPVSGGGLPPPPARRVGLVARYAVRGGQHLCRQVHLPALH